MKKYIGCLLGGAIGDALGYPVKFLTYDDILKKYGNNGINEYSLIGGVAKIADATQLSLFTANGLLYAITRGNLRGILGPLECYVTDFYQDWLLTQTEKYPVINNRTHSWLLNIPEMFSKMSPEETVIYTLKESLTNKDVLNNNGYSGLSCVAPTCMLWNYYKNNNYELSGKISALLNNNIMTILSASFLSYLLYEILHQETELNLKSVIQDIRNNIYKIFNECDKEYIEKISVIIDKAIDLTKSDIKDNDAIELIGNGWAAEEILGIVIYCAIKYSDNFEKGIIASVNHSGNSNYTGLLTGNILGAYLGQDKIPEMFIDKLELKNIIIEIAQDLNTKCPVSEYSANDDEKWLSKYLYGNYMKSK